MSMYSAELLSHCFSAGAEQNESEIRGPSIRGQLRWWFRALGGSAADEKRVFGGVHKVGDEKNGACASSLRLRVHDTCRSTVSVNLDTLGWGQFSGKAYLLWPLRPQRQNQQTRGVIRSGARFRFETSFVRDPGTELKVLAQRAVKAWLLLGAIGTRSRRGMGSLWPVDGPCPCPANENDFILALEKLQLPAGVRVVLLSGPLAHAEEALEKAGNWLKQWRAGSTKSVAHPERFGLNDHDAALGKSAKVYRPALGLPLEQRYSNDRGTYVSSIGASDRWASPVHLKVIRLGTGYHPLAVFFPNMAPSEGVAVNIRQRRGSGGMSCKLDHDLLRAMMQPPAEGRSLFPAD